jgi:hypothetical protein
MRSNAKVAAMSTFVILGLGACGGQVVIGGAAPLDGGIGANRQPFDASGTTDMPSEGAPTVNVDAGIDGTTLALPITTDVMPISPGNEVTLCQTFANPFGRDVDLVSIQATSPFSLRDVFLFRQQASSTHAQPTTLSGCSYDPLGAQPFFYSSGQAQWVATYPSAEMGYPLAAADFLMLRVHYINPTNAVDQAATKLTLNAASPGSVKIHVGSLLFRHVGFSVASTSDAGAVTATVSTANLGHYSIFASWVLAEPGDTQVQVTANGVPFFDARLDRAPSNVVAYSTLSQTPIQVDPPGTIAWGCTFMSAGQTPAMGQCIYQGYYYPADPQAPDGIANVTN